MKIYFDLFQIISFSDKKLKFSMPLTKLGPKNYYIGTFFKVKNLENNSLLSMKSYSLSGQLGKISTVL